MSHQSEILHSLIFIIFFNLDKIHSILNDRTRKQGELSKADRSPAAGFCKQTRIKSPSMAAPGNIVFITVAVLKTLDQFPLIVQKSLLKEWGKSFP